MAIELATAYVSIVPETTKLEAGLKQAFNGVGKEADRAGQEMGSRLAKTASNALKSGWRPDQDIMAGIPDTRLDRIGARMGQVIGKGVVAGLKAQQIGRDFGNSFASGAGSVGLGRVISGWRNDLQGQANKLGYLAGKGLSAGLQAGMVGATAVIGTALKTGFDRLVALDTAQNKLRSILRTQGRTEDFEKINRAVQKTVDKTPFSLDQAFGTAVQAIGAGSQDIERFMKNVADAAGFAGTDLQRMGLIFNQVLAKGKLTGEETMQLMEAGLPARSWIQKSYDMTTEQFEDMASKGQITLDHLMKAIEDNAPGMAQALGNTLQGSIDNMQTALAKTGANFLAAIFGGPTGDATEGLKSAVQRITDMLNRLNDWIVQNKDEIRDFFLGAKAAAAQVVEVLGNIANLLREHPGLIQAAVIAFAAFKTIQGISAVASALGGINGALRAMPALANGALGPIGALAAALGSVAALRSSLEWSNGDPVSALPTPSDFDPSKRSWSEILLGPFLGPMLNRSSSGSGLKGSNEGLKPNAANLKDTIAQMFPQVREIGGYRPNDPFPDHPSGRAIDVMIPPELVGTPEGKALGDRINQFALQSGLAQYTMWEQKQFNAGGGITPMEDRSHMGPGVTQNHFDHVHIYTHMGAPEVLKGAIPEIGPVQGGSPTGSDLLKRLAGIGTYDEGGLLPPGMNLVNNATGKPELILNPEQQQMLADQGIDPNSLLHGQSQGAPPGPSSPVTGAASGDPGLDFIRSMGFIPAAASSSGVAGTSSLAGFINMGNQVVSGVIDTGVNLANQAVSAAIALGAAGGGMGAGAAAAPIAQMAASYGIQLAGNQAKRISQYWFGLAGIGADALVEQLSPFGTPRWLGYDYTNFMPQLGIQQALTSTVEKMGSDAISRAFPQPGVAMGDPGGPVNPSTMPGAAAPLPPPPPPNAPPNIDPSGPSTTTPPAPTLPIPMLPIPGLFDDGGMLPPGGFAVNMTSRPEPVLTPQQWDAIAASSSEPNRSAPLVENLYAQDMQEAIRRLEQTKRRDMMQYAGRP